MRATRKVAIVAGAVVVTVAMALAGCMTLLASGGAGNVIRNLKPAPDVDGPAITRKRRSATEEIEGALAAIDAGTEFTSFATSTDDRCYKGENNWKIKDGYAHRCTVRMTRFHGMNGDFRAHVIGLEDLLASSGWQLPRSTLPDVPPATFREMFASYYDRYCSGRQIAVFGSGAIGPRCEVSQLPRSRSGGYRKGNVVLWIEVVERGESNLNLMDYTQRVSIGALYKEHDEQFNLYEKKSLQDVEALVRAITESHRYVLSASAERTYFEN